MRVTSCEPLVSVPVLSNTMVVIFRDASKAVLFRINRPFLAETLVDIAATNGTANPSACGQEITITVTIRSIAKAIVSPNANHVKNVPKPNTNAIMVSHLAATSARRSEERRVGKESRSGRAAAEGEKRQKERMEGRTTIYKRE